MTYTIDKKHTGCIRMTFSNAALMGSAYMPYDAEDPPSQTEVRKLVKFAEERGLELLLGCEANAHHEAWGSSNVNLRREQLHDFLCGTHLLILNRGIEPTFLDSKRQEVIDITMGTKGVASLIRDWRVSKEPSGSDH